jgi:hypothetical protein
MTSQKDQGHFPESMDAFIRTYHKDAKYFEYAVRAFKKNGTPFRKLVIVCPQGDGHIFTEICERNGLKNFQVHEKQEILSKGYDEQMLDKLTPDWYTNAEYICMLDSDSILAHPMKYEEFFRDGKPLHVYRERNECPEVCHMWMKTTAMMIGEIDKENEYMTRLGQMYPRTAFEQVRAHVQQHQGVSMVDWLKRKDNETKDIVSHTGAYVSEFESLGAVLYNKHHDAVTWCKHPVGNCVDGQRPPIIQGWSHDTPLRYEECFHYFQCVIDLGDDDQSCKDRKAAMGPTIL